MKAILSAQNLSKRFGGIHAVKNVSFDLHAGEMLALIGPNGAGKSTCFNLINGQIQADSGEVFLNEKRLNWHERHTWPHLGMARTFQIAATFISFTALENVQIAVLAHHKKSFNLWLNARQQYVDEAHELLTQVGLNAHALRPASQLAYADMKRLELAMALASEPKVLLMDEPTAGMAAQERHDLMALAQKICAQENRAVLFTEHAMDVVFEFANRVLVLAEGQLIAAGSVREIRAHPEVQRVYFGQDAQDKTKP
jgi:branched-chain amino acid transport system ATP-binding protein